MSAQKSSSSGLGVCLFGGSGTRLGRWTQKVANKHLVLIGDKTIADLVAEQMAQTGFKNCCFITGTKHAEQLSGYFGDGRDWGFDQVEFKYQLAPDGIPSALALAEPLQKSGDCVFLHLGDNIIDHDFRPEWDDFVRSGEGCRLFLKEVKDPSRFGVAELKDGELVSIEEKPKAPKSNLAVIGAYFFDATVFKRIAKLSKSARGETEVVDLIRSYMADSKVSCSVIKGFYSDAGVPEQIARVMKWYFKKTYGRDIDD